MSINHSQREIANSAGYRNVPVRVLLRVAQSSFRSGTYVRGSLAVALILYGISLLLSTTEPQHRWLFDGVGKTALMLGVVGVLVDAALVVVRFLRCVRLLRYGRIAVDRDLFAQRIVPTRLTGRMAASWYVGVVSAVPIRFSRSGKTVMSDQTEHQRNH